METQKSVRFNVGDRVYELVPNPKTGEHFNSGSMMEAWAKKFGANLSEEDGRFIIEHASEIPAWLREVYLVIAGWRDQSRRETVYFLHFYHNWKLSCNRLIFYNGGPACLVRRVS